MSATTRAFTEPDRLKGLQIRFITIGGSYVDVIGPGEYSDKNRWRLRRYSDHTGPHWTPLTATSAALGSPPPTGVFRALNRVKGRRASLRPC